MTISIITINYNDLDGLRTTMSSVLNQTYGAIEYIIIDGGSIDGSKAYIENHKHAIAYWVSEADGGIYNAMNKGIAKATGDYVLFLNSGDSLYNPNVLSDIANSITSSKDIYYGDIVWKHIDGSSEHVTYPNELSFHFFYASALPHQSTLIRRSLFEDLFYYNENYKVISDLEFLTLAICKHNASYEKIDLIISNFDMDGISNQLEGRHLIKTERETMYKEHFLLFYKDYEVLQNLKAIKRHYNSSVLLQAKSSPRGKKIINTFLKFISVFLKKNQS